MPFECDHEKCDRTFDSEKALKQHKRDYDHSELEDNRSLLTKVKESQITTYAGFALAAVLLLGSAYYLFTLGVFSSTPSEELGEPVPVVSTEHIQAGQTGFDYNSNPPTSGPHYASPINPGFYRTEKQDEALVHNIEHGQIWITYQNVSSNTTDALENLASEYPNAVVVTPRSSNDAPLTVASWGRLMKLESYNQTKIEAYIEAYVNNSPEPFASIP